MGYANTSYFQIVIMVNHKQDICSHVVAEWFHSDLWNKQ